MPRAGRLFHSDSSTSRWTNPTASSSTTGTTATASSSVRPKGFHGKTVPKTATFSAHSGQLLVRFKSDALRNERGRRAVSLRPGLDHLIQRGGLLPVRMQIRIRTQSGLLVRRRPRTGQRRRPLSVHQRFIRREGIFIRPKENVRLSNKGGWCGAESGSANNWLG